MQCIVTEYHGYTVSRGPRIIAISTSGEMVTISYDGSLAGIHAHFQVAQALCRKLGWTGEMISGEMQKGYAFVFLNSECRHTLEPLAISHPKRGSDE